MRGRRGAADTCRPGRHLAPGEAEPASPRQGNYRVTHRVVYELAGVVSSVAIFHSFKLFEKTVWNKECRIETFRDAIVDFMNYQTVMFSL